MGEGLETGRLVLASFNKGKRREVAALLDGIGMEILSPTDFGMHDLPPETGETFLDNAIIKAAAVAKASGLMAAGDDSGLEVDALGGQPGVRSARYAGDAHDDAANNRRLLAELKDVDDRSARFVCTVALVVPFQVCGCILDPVVSCGPRPGGPRRGLPVPVVHPLVPAGWMAFAATGAVDGVIIDDARGTDGFGYDPIFLKPELGRTFAELTGEEKNALSHRGQAFTSLIPLIRALAAFQRQNEFPA
jgi:XTP/dITP diphosphohydrolase